MAQDKREEAQSHALGEYTRRGYEPPSDRVAATPLVLLLVVRRRGLRARGDSRGRRGAAVAELAPADLPLGALAAVGRPRVRGTHAERALAGGLVVVWGHLNSKSGGGARVLGGQGHAPPTASHNRPTTASQIVRRGRHRRGRRRRGARARGTAASVGLFTSVLDRHGARRGAAEARYFERARARAAASQRHRGHADVRAPRRAAVRRRRAAGDEEGGGDDARRRAEGSQPLRDAREKRRGRDAGAERRKNDDAVDARIAPPSTAMVDRRSRDARNGVATHPRSVVDVVRTTLSAASPPPSNAQRFDAWPPLTQPRKEVIPP